MRYSTTSGMMLAALSIGEAMAGPTHAHLHRNAHEKRDVDYAKLDWNNMGVDWSSAWAAGQHDKTAVSEAPVATPPASAAAAPAASITPAASPSLDSYIPANVIVDEITDLFEELVGLSNHRTSFGEYSKLPGGSDAPGAGSQGDFFSGNIGAPYGSNMVKVTSTDGHDFTNTFINTQSKTITINLWNKAGPDFKPLSGSSLAPVNTSLTFALAAGAKQVVAFMKDSQVAWAQPCTGKTMSGAFSTTWGEANFVPTGSGYDVSAIPNANGNSYNMCITSNEVQCTSDITQNFWLTASQPIGGSDGSCYVPGSTMHLVTKMGGPV